MSLNDNFVPFLNLNFSNYAKLLVTSRTVCQTDSVCARPWDRYVIAMTLD